jgi:hypothetical protein
MREIVNGIFYVMRAGCPWRLLLNDLPPWGTIYRWFAVWRDDGRFTAMLLSCGWRQHGESSLVQEPLGITSDAMTQPFSKTALLLDELHA